MSETADEILAEVYQRLEKDESINLKKDLKSYLKSSKVKKPKHSKHSEPKIPPKKEPETAPPVKTKDSNSTKNNSSTTNNASSSKKIVIGSLTEKTKTILSKQNDESSSVQKSSSSKKHQPRLTEDGELIRSDVSSNEEEIDDVKDESEGDTDGEINESDDEKRRKKKKKRKHKHRSSRCSHRSSKRHRHSPHEEKDRKLMPPPSSDPRNSTSGHEHRSSSARVQSNSTSSSKYWRRSRSPASRDRAPRDRNRDHDNRTSSAVSHSYDPGHDERIKKYRTDRSRSRERRKREESRSRYKRSGSKDRGRSGSKLDSGRINKKELLEIARRNASAMLQQGTLQQICNMGSEEIAKLKAGGTSVDELVDYCKKLQNKKEKLEKKKNRREKSDDESSSSRSTSSDPPEVTFHHPFALNPQRNNIVFNVRNITQLPTKTPAERALDDCTLKSTFPVSSGQQHRTKELEWRPVSPPLPVAAQEKKKIEYRPKEEPAQPSTSSTADIPLPLPPPPPPPPVTEVAPEAAPSTSTEAAPNADNVFKEPSKAAPVDIGEVVASRLKAIRRLYDNPTDAEALKMMHFAEEQMRKWAESKNVPGAFLGGTGAQCLKPEQLGPRDPKFSAWAKRDQIMSAKPLESGVGMALLQKMGWKPGEGLGKNKEGALKPLSLEIKSDRKGLVSNEELIKNRPRPQSLLKMTPMAGAGGGYFSSGKHPVSALMELCAKRRWNPPSFTCLEQGPLHNRRFLWKVLINGVEYQPATPSNNKKNAKTQSAQVALQSLGLAPRDSSLPVIIG